MKAIDMLQMVPPDHPMFREGWTITFFPACPGDSKPSPNPNRGSRNQGGEQATKEAKVDEQTNT